MKDFTLFKRGGDFFCAVPGGQPFCCLRGKRRAMRFAHYLRLRFDSAYALSILNRQLQQYNPPVDEQTNN